MRQFRPGITGWFFDDEILAHHRRVAVYTAFFQRNEIWPNVAFFKNEHTYLVTRSNLTRNTMINPAVTEQVNATNFSIDYQSLNKITPFINRTGIVDGTRPAIKELVSAIEIDLVNGESTLLKILGKAREEGSDRALQQQHITAHNAGLWQYSRPYPVA